MKIVLINGVGGSGKDTLVLMCRDILGSEVVGNISTVDFVKEVATFCGWDGTKTPENRKFLSDLKKLLAEWDDVPTKKVIEAVDNFVDYLVLYGLWDAGIVFIHCREPEQIKKLVDEFNGNVTTLLIRRDAAEAVTQINDSDNSVLEYDYDYTIWNDSNLSCLRNEAMVFLRDCLGFNI